MERLDHWIGRTLFVPIIIRFCQWSGWSQYSLYDYLWLLGSYALLIASAEDGVGAAIIPFAFALYLTVNLGFSAKYQRHESPFSRRLLLIVNAAHVLAHITGKTMILAGPNWDLSCSTLLMWLTAEYALTIKTIPPLPEDVPASEALIDRTATPEVCINGR